MKKLKIPEKHKTVLLAVPMLLVIAVIISFVAYDQIKLRPFPVFNTGKGVIVRVSNSTNWNNNLLTDFHYYVHSSLHDYIYTETGTWQRFQKGDAVTFLVLNYDNIANLELYVAVEDE